MPEEEAHNEAARVASEAVIKMTEGLATMSTSVAVLGVKLESVIAGLVELRDKLDNNYVTLQMHDMMVANNKERDIDNKRRDKDISNLKWAMAFITGAATILEFLFRVVLHNP